MIDDIDKLVTAMRVLSAMFPIFMVGQIIDLASLGGAILQGLSILREQLSEIIDRVMTVMIFIYDKAYDFTKLIFEFFPYDNYQRAFILSVIAMIVMTSLLVLFGVAQYSQPRLLGGFTGIGGVPNPNAVGSPDELTIGIGRETLRERVGEGGSGIVPEEDMSSPTTIPSGVGSGTTGDTDKDGVPDESDTDIDNDGKMNDVDSDIDGDGIDNTNDDTPCGEYIQCPTDVTSPNTNYISICGNGICDYSVTGTRSFAVAAGLDDNILYYRIPYWCLAEGESVDRINVEGVIYYGVVGSSYLAERLNDFCSISSVSHEVIYQETTGTCPQDCVSQNQTTLPYPDFCYNQIWDEDRGEEDRDCGGLCVPCHCANGIKDANETGIDCGGRCPQCACTLQGSNTQCISGIYTEGILEFGAGYCCPTGTGICTNRCMRRYIGTLPSCCTYSIVDGAYRCRLELCEEACSWGYCTIPQLVIINANNTAVSGNEGVLWQY